MLLEPRARTDAATHDRRARFEQIFATYYRAVLVFARRRTDPATAADVAAETMLVAWRRLDELPPGDAVRPWLFGVAHRILANTRRGDARRRRLVERMGGMAPAPPAAPDLPAEWADLGPEIRDAIADLSEADRDVLHLAVTDGLTPSDAAAVLGCSPNTFAARLMRARRRLLGHLAARGVYVAGRSQQVARSHGGAA